MLARTAAGRPRVEARRGERIDLSFDRRDCWINPSPHKMDRSSPAAADVELLLPRQIDRAARFLALRHKEAQRCGGDDATACCLTLRVRPSRVLWLALRPLLFGGGRRARHRARRALGLLLDGCYDWDRVVLDRYPRRQQQSGDGREGNKGTGAPSSGDTAEGFCIQRRNVKRVPIPSSALRSTKQHATERSLRRIVLWIQPPSTTHVEYLFAGLLIRWESRFIQAQSLAGFIATLGGGFFLCHHFSTAILLAKQQQRLAVLLNDESMYYACAVNQAYSCIYNGKFRTARSILRQVMEAITSGDHDADPVLVKMCRSARFFERRMRRASRSKLLQSTTPRGDDDENVDDFQRIRVVRDKSRVDDLVIPFSRATSA